MRQAFLKPDRLVFLDESGFRLGASPRFGWAPRGEDAYGLGVYGHWEHVTMIGAIVSGVVIDRIANGSMRTQTKNSLASAALAILLLPAVQSPSAVSGICCSCGCVLKK